MQNINIQILKQKNVLKQGQIVKEKAKEKNVNIIVYDNKIPLTISPQFYGYNLYKQVESYDIYVLNE